MKVYLAYSENYHNLLLDAHARIIISYGRKHGTADEAFLPPGFNDFLIDSGGFQLARKTHERQQLSGDNTLKAYTMWLQFILDKYKDIVKGYVGLDTADWGESIRNYDYMRSEGLTCIPVWKAFWPEEVLDALCQEYDYVAVGGVAFGASKIVLRHIFERVTTRYPETKLHMLGVGIRGGVAFKTYRPYSVDVSTWGVPARYGHDIVFDKDQVLKEVKLPDDLRQKLRDSQEFEEQMLTKAIRLMQSLETKLEELHEPHQIQMEV